MEKLVSPSATDPLLQACGLASVRGDRILFDTLDITLAGGELLYVEGANGSGKTTLLRILTGLIEPTRGELLWRGEPIDELAEEYGRELVYIGHRPGIKEELSALENLQFAARLDGAAAHRDALLDALAHIGLTGFEELPGRQLSQGQKRRVAMARLLLTDAPLWVLDEPFVALDTTAVDTLRQLIADHVRGGGVAILTTHQPVELAGCSCRRLRLGGQEGDDV